MSSDNTVKSRNGYGLEKQFTLVTGLKKLLKADKPQFINEHGINQVVDSDYAFERDGKKIYFDLTTTYRSDRAKQKAYNAMICKLKFDHDCEFYIVAGDVKDDGSGPSVYLVEGLDGVISIESAIRMVTG